MIINGKGLPRPWRRLLLLFVWLVTAGCAAAQSPGAEPAWEADAKWLYADQPRAVVVLIHGFNLDPAVMTEMENMLRSAGMDVISLSLTGRHEHNGNGDTQREFLEVTDFSVWQTATDAAFADASLRAAELGSPLYLVGYSLGGLLGADYINRSPASIVERSVMLAPALSLRWTSWLLRPLGVLPDFLLPSVGPSRYRASDFVPVSAYEALYQGVEQFRERASTDRLNIPTLVLIDESDELVSDGGLEAFIEEHELSNWELRHIEKSEGADVFLDHVIVDRNALGGEAWQTVTGQIRGFLSVAD